MVKLEIKEKDGKVINYYMDGGLNKKIHSKIIPAIHRNDEDYVIAIDGEERGGKSVLAQQVGKTVDPSLTVDRICFSPDEFRNAITHAKKGQCVIFDEAFSGMGSTAAMSTTNRVIKSMMMEMGQKNLFVIIVLPTFFDLDKYAAIWRTRQLIHVYRKKGKRGFFIVFGKNSKKYMHLMGKKTYDYKYGVSNMRGRFYNQYVIDEVAYRKKKEKSLKESFSVEKKTKFHDQRDRIIYLLSTRCGMNQTLIAEECKNIGIKLSRQSITHILAQFNDTPPILAKS